MTHSQFAVGSSDNSGHSESIFGLDVLTWEAIFAQMPLGTECRKAVEVSSYAYADDNDAVVAADALRLGVLATGERLSEEDVLRLALQQAVGALAGLGGLAHLAGSEPGILRLAAVTGVPTGLGRLWDSVAVTTEAAPARAVREGTIVWSPGPLSWPVEAGGEVPPGWGDLGMLSAPVWVENAAVGALSVLTNAPPPVGRRSFLAELAAAVGDRLPHARRVHTGSTPWWQEPLGTRERVMRQVKVGAWSWDLMTGLLVIDETTRDLLRLAGLDPDAWDHRIESWMARIHPDDRPGVREAIEDALASGAPYAVEYRVLDAAGSVSWLELRAAFEYDAAGEPTRMAGTAWDVTARRSMDWLVGLLELHPDPIYVVSAENRVEWANRAARGHGGPENANLTTPPKAISTLHGTESAKLFVRARATPGAVAAAEVESWEDERGESAHYWVTAVEVGGFVAVQMADVTEIRKAERAASERAGRIAELNAALVRALDTRDVVGAVRQHVLPLFNATGLIVHDLTGPEPRLVGAAGYPPDVVALLQAPGTPETKAVSNVTTMREPQFISSIAEFERYWPALLPLARRSGKQSWAILPLTVGIHPVGSCTISWTSPHRFSDDDKSLLTTLAAFIAQALGNARLYEQARNRARRLQEELLPSVLPELTAVHTAARYRPASGQEVGGDWYDTVPLPGGRVLAVIGDVMGHGFEQAITMGIIRHAALTVAALDLPVDEMMAHLDDVVGRLARRADSPGVYATCLLVQYDATTGMCQIVSAGHPPPVIVRPGAHPETLAIPVGAPLGLAQVPAEVADVTLDADTVLVLYTDGLLGADAPDTEALTAAVARHAADVPWPPRPSSSRTDWLEGLCTAVTTQLAPDQRHDDDAALLTLAAGRVADGCVVSWTLPWAPESAGQARLLTVRQLSSWQLDDLADAALLIVSELIGNAVRHAVGLGANVDDDVTEDLSQDLTLRQPSMIRLRLLHLDGALVCEVYDGSEATPRVRHPSFDDEFGRGLQLVAMTAQQWGARYAENGKCIWARLGSTATKT